MTGDGGAGGGGEIQEEGAGCSGGGSDKDHKASHRLVPSRGLSYGGGCREARPEDCPAAGVEAGERLTWEGTEGNFEMPLDPEQGRLMGKLLHLSASG